jgi:HPr kinase/phosphorylase
MYSVNNFYQDHGKTLNLELFAGEAGLSCKIRVPEVHRPGISLSGYLKGFAGKRILIFGRVEIEYLRQLEQKTRLERLENILSQPIPAIFITRRYRPPEEIYNLCEKYNIPLFRTNMSAMNLLNKLTLILMDEFSPRKTYHGTLLDVFGVGMMIKGESSVGKSEAALGLIERGHRLVSDDVIHIKLREDSYLEGYGADVTRHHMEIRGVGIINVANLYGAVCIRDSISIDIIVELENWEDDKYYDRIGLDDNFCDILGVKLPYNILPVKPGRDVILLLETIALNHRLKAMGYNSAHEFNAKLLSMMTKKRRLVNSENNSPIKGSE